MDTGGDILSEARVHYLNEVKIGMTYHTCKMTY